MTDNRFSAQLLPHRAVLSIIGENPIEFLHNLLTVDLMHLAKSQAKYGALLTPQGKILYDFFIFHHGDHLLIDCARSQRSGLIARLGLYRLRAVLKFEPRDDLAIVASPSPISDGVGFSDPRVAAMGWRSFVANNSTYQASPNYEALRLTQGLADSDADLGSDKFYPHEANFDQFAGVSFTKGCYIGQEVISRIEHRSTARQRILPITVPGEVPSPGHAIISGEQKIGETLSHHGDHGLALLRLDRLAEAQSPLTCQTMSVSVIRPDWLNYPVRIGAAS